MADKVYTDAEIAEAETHLKAMKASRPVKKFADMTADEQRTFERSIGISQPMRRGA
jgi:hypothetical protein